MLKVYLNLIVVVSLLIRNLSLKIRMSSDFSLEKIASKWKIIQYGQGNIFGVECADRSYIDEKVKVTVSQKGGLGLSLLEAQVGKLNSGLVLIDEIFPGSNAEKAGGLLVGDALIAICSVQDSSASTSVEGLNFDATLKELRRFSEYSDISLTVKRLVPRKEVTVKMVGPQGEDAGSFTVLSGYGANLRTALQSKNMKMYDSRTARFDSPYETGNCAGEGTCGTCAVAILEGRELLNEKVRVEEKALRVQGAPPNYRWACRTQITPGVNKEGVLKIKLRPQSTSW